MTCQPWVGTGCTGVVYRPVLPLGGQCWQWRSLDLGALESRSERGRSGRTRVLSESECFEGR